MKSNISVRERLIRTASELFYKQGYINTGINEIIEKANVAKSSLYSHFKTKDELLIAYLNERETQLINALEVYTKSQAIGSARILAFFDFLFEFYNTEEYRGCWCINTLSEIPATNLQLKNVILSHKRNLMHYIYTAVEENLKTETPEKISKQIYLLYEAAVMESYLQNDNWPILEAKEMTAKIIL